MLLNVRKNGEKKRRPQLNGHRSVKFPGLLNDALAIKVHRNTLWLALTGRRTDRRSKEVLALYKAFKTKQEEEQRGLNA